MAWELDNDRPIYAQIVETVMLRIVSGFYPPGEKLPSVRELAAEAGVNPNTMQKAFGELEKGGLIITIRTSGRVVTENTDLIKEAREEIAKSEVQQFLEKMSRLGIDAKQASEFLEKVSKEGLIE